jgi:CelD/BcsL family acetyltransferase involved in cellulose biosynthesis
MQIQTIHTSDEFLRLRAEWNALLEASDSNCVFLTHEWLSTWWKHLAEGRRLHIMTARKDGDLVGVLPLAERAPQLARMMPRILEFLGSGLIGSDYLDAIVAKGSECEVMAAFADHLNRRGMMLQLSQLRGGACAAAALAEELRRRTWIVAEEKSNICPYIDLRGHTWETYLATLGQSIRKNVTRYLRQLPKAFDMRFDCITTSAEAQGALDVNIDLHRKRWAAAGTSEAFHSTPIVAFHREFVDLAAERGWLRLLVVTLDETPAASLYGLHYGPTFYFYQSGFNPAFAKHSVGVATMGLAIQTAIEGGASEYDFLHGNEEYKFHWAKVSRDIVRLELHPGHRAASIYRRAIQFNRAARQVARRMLTGIRAHATVDG